MAALRIELDEVEVLVDTVESLGWEWVGVVLFIAVVVGG